MRHAARKDRNHIEISKHLIANGFQCFDLSAAGDGWPDLLVLAASGTTFFEIKDGKKPPSQRGLTPSQVAHFYRMRKAPIHVVESLEQALQVARASTALEARQAASKRCRGCGRVWNGDCPKCFEAAKKSINAVAHVNDEIHPSLASVFSGFEEWLHQKLEPKKARAK